MILAIFNLLVRDVIKEKVIRKGQQVTDIFHGGHNRRKEQMISSGFFLKSDDIRIVTLSGVRESHERIADKVHKLKLPVSSTKEDVDLFIQTLKAFCSDYKIDLILINYRNYKGPKAGSAATFRNEGIIMATSPVPVHLVHFATIAATNRKYNELKSLKPKTKDLGTAYDLAFEGLE